MDRQRRLVVGYVGLVVAVLAAYIAIYNYGMAVWEGNPQPIHRSVQGIVQTVTTVGYGGDAPHTSPQMNYFLSIVQLSSLVLIFAALPVLVVPLFEDAFRTTAPTAVSGLEDHIVICNYGPREEVLIEELLRRDVDYVIVHADRDVATDLYTDGYSVIYGNPEQDETLERARLEHARTLIVDIDDETNPSVLLAGWEVDPDARAISIVEEPERADYHRYAGADHVFAPREALGENLADKAIGAFSPEAVEAISIDEEFEVAEFPLQSGSELIGRTIVDSGIREQTGAAVIGAWYRGTFESPPPADARFDARSIILAAGTEPELDRLKEMTLTERRPHQGHVVVVGMGVVGRTIAAELDAAGLSYATVDLASGPDVDVVGEATDRDVLEAAGADEAATVVLALPDDAATIFAAFVVRELNPAVELIARADNVESVSKLYSAGADYALSLATVSGRMLASIVLDERIISPSTQIKLVRTPIAIDEPRSLADLRIRNRTGCTVVVVERVDEAVTDLHGDFVVEPGDELVVAGTDPNIDRFLTTFA
ncbi:potassium channel family protein [Halosolutus gelatinilyticus]|uniref:potassium channel family protein n=1 Tax=Halosolutus gelatinilyticus TaxID=2931975 RepID=UPI001FF4A3D8|nr:NAD-binding protein [Halosolutus gelatinilyticus]